MFKIGDHVVYRTNLCKIIDVKNITHNNKDYYILQSITDPSLIINAPVDNSYEFMRNIISKEEAEKIIAEIPYIEIMGTDIKNIENDYINLLKTGDHKDLIRIIKTAYLRNEERASAKKKISETDNTYFNKAEKILYNEFSLSLGLSYDDTKKYVVDKVTSLAKRNR
jgi:CarD family transcriptional regulator